jgi:hypothetical protein
MPDYLYRRWSPPDGGKIEDIHGWLQDLEAAQAFFARLCDEFEAEKPDDTLIDALATAAVVRYSRCFASGMRARLNPNDTVPALGERLLSLHERIRGVRDWHVAHPVNNQEVHTLMVILEAAPYRVPGAIGFSSRTTAELPLDADEMRAAIGLCIQWIAFLKQRFLEEQRALIPVANRLSREELLALPEEENQTDSNILARRRQRTK